MPRIAFKMKLHPGQIGEYKRRHDALWPELAELLRETGVRDYSIFWTRKRSRYSAFWTWISLNYSMRCPVTR